MNVRSIWSLRGRARPAWAAALAATLAVLGGPGLAAATTYYVGPGGNDGNAGTSSSAPWATTAKANSTMNPGDVCQVLAGSFGTIAPLRSGTATGRITYIGSLASPAATTVSSINLTSRDYVTVKGFRASSGAIEIPGAASNDSLAFCTGGPITIAYGHDNVIYRCTGTSNGKNFLFDCQDTAVPDNAAEGYWSFQGDRLRLRSGQLEAALRGVSRSTIDSCRFFLTIPAGSATDVHFMTSYVGRSITFNDNYFLNTNMTTDDRRHFQFRDHTMLWTAARDTFVVNPASVGEVSGIWSTSGAYLHTYHMYFDRMLVQVTSSGFGAFLFQQNCPASSITNSVLIATKSARIMSIDGPQMDSLNFVHNTCVSLAAPDRGVFMQDGAAETHRTVRHNIFVSQSSSTTGNGSGVGYFHGPVLGAGNSHNYNLFFCRAGLGSGYAVKQQFTYSAVGMGTPWNGTASRPDSSSRWGDPMFANITATGLDATPLSGSAAVGSQWPDGYVGAVFASSGPDTRAPNTVSDLSVQSVFDSSVVLRWTAPGDDGAVGTASAYELRMSTSGVINDANFGSATVVSPSPIPAPGGTVQTYVVMGLTSGTTYYFAIRARDEAGNTAGASNSPQAVTSATDTTPPAAIGDLSTSP